VGSAVVMSLLVKILALGINQIINNNYEYEIQITYTGLVGYLYGGVPVLGDK
jgi:hypothetical protein